MTDPEEKTINYYNQQAKKYYEQTINVDMSPLYEQFLNYLEPQSHILDAGCGSGRDSLYFLEHGYQVTAIDAAKNLAQLAEDLIAQPVLKMKLQDLDYKSKFNGIWACASLLHLQSDKMQQVLKKFAAALVTEGIIYISLQYGEGEEFKNGRFFNYYTEKSWLKLMQEIEELEVLKLWKTDDKREDRSGKRWLNVLLQKKERKVGQKKHPMMVF